MSDASVVFIAAYFVGLIVSYVVCLLLHVTGLMTRIDRWLEKGN